MKIVLLESLGVPQEVLEECAKPLIDAGHSFTAYPKDTDPKVQIERAKDADVIMLSLIHILDRLPGGVRQAAHLF